MKTGRMDFVKTNLKLGGKQVYAVPQNRSLQGCKINGVIVAFGGGLTPDRFFDAEGKKVIDLKEHKFIKEELEKTTLSAERLMDLARTLALLKHSDKEVASEFLNNPSMNDKEKQIKIGKVIAQTYKENLYDLLRAKGEGEKNFSDLETEALRGAQIEWVSDKKKEWEIVDGIFFNTFFAHLLELIKIKLAGLYGLESEEFVI